MAWARSPCVPKTNRGGRSQEGCAASASRPVAASHSTAASARPARSWRAVTRERFLLRETRIVAGLMQEGLSAQEILARVQEENAFQYPTKASLGNICRTCLMRLDALGAAGPELARVIATAPLTQAAQANLYAMMRAYAVVWEFMTRVVAYKYRTLDITLLCATSPPSSRTWRPRSRPWPRGAPPPSRARVARCEACSRSRGIWPLRAPRSSCPSCPSANSCTPSAPTATRAP